MSNRDIPDDDDFLTIPGEFLSSNRGREMPPVEPPMESINNYHNQDALSMERAEQSTIASGSLVPPDAPPPNSNLHQSNNSDSTDHRSLTASATTQTAPSEVNYDVSTSSLIGIMQPVITSAKSEPFQSESLVPHHEPASSNEEFHAQPVPEPDMEREPKPEPDPIPIALADNAFESFLETGDVEAADVAIDHYKNIFEEVNHDPAQPELPRAERVRVAGKLSAVLTHRFEHLGDVDDMEQAVEFQTKAAALALNDPDPVLQRESMVGLGRALTSQFEHTGDPVDAELAVEKLGEALAKMPQDSPARPAVLGDVAKAQLARYMHFDEEGDLNQALDNCQEAINALPQDSPERAPLSNVLGKALLARFERSGDATDIDSAVTHLSAAVAQAGALSPDRPKRLKHYGDALLARFESQGNEEDLQEAITTQTQALELLKPESTTLPVVSGSLGAAYHMRYKRLGRSLADLDGAIEYYKTAVELTPFSSPEYARVTDQLARAFISKYRVAPNIELLDHAIMLHRQAVAFTPDHSRYRLERVTHLGSAYSRRYRSHHGPQRPSDRAEAIRALTEASNLIGANTRHPRHGFVLAELTGINDMP